MAGGISWNHAGFRARRPFCAEARRNVGSESSPNRSSSCLSPSMTGELLVLSTLVSCRDSDAVPGLTGEILAIYVDPNRWHAGIGQGLLGAALSGLKLAGFNEATLWVLDSNSRARVFYERAGFSCDGATKSEMVGDNAQIQELRYRRPL